MKRIFVKTEEELGSILPHHGKILSTKENLTLRGADWCRVMEVKIDTKEIVTLLAPEAFFPLEKHFIAHKKRNQCTARCRELQISIGL